MHYKAVLETQCSPARDQKCRCVLMFRSSHPLVSWQPMVIPWMDIETLSPHIVFLPPVSHIPQLHPLLPRQPMVIPGMDIERPFQAISYNSKRWLVRHREQLYNSSEVLRL